MAASKKTAALGNVSSAMAKNDALRWGAFTAHSESKYRPNAATPPENRHVIMPGIMPEAANAYIRTVSRTYKPIEHDVGTHKGKREHACTVITITLSHKML